MKTEDKAYHEKFDEVKSRPKVANNTNKTSITITIILITVTFITNAQTVEGKWTTYNEETGTALSTIEIVKAGNSIEGKVTEIFLEPFQGDDPVCTKTFFARSRFVCIAIEVDNCNKDQAGGRNCNCERAGRCF